MGTQYDESHQVRQAEEIQVTLVMGQASHECQTVDVGPRGVFIRTEAVPREHQLVRLNVVLPAGDEFLINGMVERIVTPEEAETTDEEPGIGVSFYGMGLKHSTLWDDFVESWCSTHDAAEESLCHEGEGEPAEDPEPALQSQSRPSEELRISDLDWDASEILPPFKDLDTTLQKDEAEAILLTKKKDSGLSPDETDQEDEEINDGPDGAFSTIELSEEDEVLVEIHEEIPTESGDQGSSEASGFAPGVVELPAGVGEEENYRFEDMPTHEYAFAIAKDPTLLDRLPGTQKKPPPKKAAPWSREPTILMRAAGHTDVVDHQPGRSSSVPPPTARRSASVARPPSHRPRSVAPALPSPYPRSSSRPPWRLGLAPGGNIGNVVYRLLLPSVDSLRDFASTALQAGGVFIRTDDLRPPGTPAIVCLVHPLDGREFHLPGFVRALPPDKPGVAIKFTEVTTRTIADFHIFLRPQPSNPHSQPESEWTIPIPKQDSIELTLVEESSANLKEGSLEENTHEFRVADLASLLDSLPALDEEDEKVSQGEEQSSDSDDES
jgi:hypothetical protein